MPSEFLLVCIEDLKLRYIKSKTEDLFGLTVKDVQIDNQLPLATFPVFLQRLGMSSSTTLRNKECRHLLSDGDLRVDLMNHPLIDVLLKRRMLEMETPGHEYLDRPIRRLLSNGKKINAPFNHVEFARIILLGLIVRTDLELVSVALLVTQQYRKLFDSQSSNQSHEQLSFKNTDCSAPLLDDPLLIVESSGDGVSAFAIKPVEHEASSTKFFIDDLHINPLLLHLSVSAASLLTQPPANTGLIHRQGG